MSRSGYVGLGKIIAKERQDTEAAELMASGMTEEEARAKVKPISHQDIPRHEKFVRARLRKDGSYTTSEAKNVAIRVVSISNNHN